MMLGNLKTVGLLLSLGTFDPARCIALAADKGMGTGCAALHSRPGVHVAAGCACKLLTLLGVVSIICVVIVMS